MEQQQWSLDKKMFNKIEKIPDESREKGNFEVLDIIMDKINEIIDWINSQS